MEKAETALVRIFTMFDFKTFLSGLTGPADSVSIFAPKIHFPSLMKALFFFTLSLLQLEGFDPQ